MAKRTLVENIQRVKASLQERFDTGKQAMRDDFFGSKTDWSYFCYQGANIEILNKLTDDDFRSAVVLGKMFAGSASVGEKETLTFPNGKNYVGMFYKCALQETPIIKAPNGNTFSNMYRESTNLLKAGELDSKNGKYFDGIFYGCTNITHIIMDVSNAETLSYAFYNCVALKQIYFRNEIPCDINLQWSKQLDDNVLCFLIKDLKDYSFDDLTYPPTITLSAESWALLEKYWAEFESGSVYDYLDSIGWLY